MFGGSFSGGFSSGVGAVPAHMGLVSCWGTGVERSLHPGSGKLFRVDRLSPPGSVTINTDSDFASAMEQQLGATHLIDGYPEMWDENGPLGLEASVVGTVRTFHGMNNRGALFSVGPGDGYHHDIGLGYLTGDFSAMVEYSCHDIGGLSTGSHVGIGHGNAFWLNVVHHAFGGCRAQITTDQGQQQIILDPYKWGFGAVGHHTWCMTFDSSSREMRLYVDGQLEGSLVIQGTIIVPTGSSLMYGGTDGHGNDTLDNGSLLGGCVWTRALTPQQAESMTRRLW